ncbi:LOW QUALITY PROTEIN: uncharacterized protein LOC131227738 [Magnolia sinica]|uniref:LOW QUALITY PROTEIN: uncharacterized protein LOC131227738 n=1 Tax=Magnolia sinica TaxID=86752 RepID=UPI002659B510|nr:LOW QUALITY PROTEIN: uncharacterized protein LOC131227738 [Magnolia sinica]
MEATAIPIPANLNTRNPLSSYSFPSLSLFPSKASLSPSNPNRRLLQIKAKQLRNLKPVKASASYNPSPSSDSSERWLLEPIGDGDTRHIGFRVPLPNAFEIASNTVTVGRVPEKADIVIPVATVSGLHARLEKRNEPLLVTDLDSTNRTFIDEMKLKPGVVTPVLPGSCLTFGDIHLAIFRVLKLENVDLPSKPDESEMKAEADSVSVNAETAT